MKTISQETITQSVNKLKPHPANPRQGDVGAIVESIERNGFYGTIIVQKSSGYVLAGNHRLKAAKQLGITEVPVTIVDVDDDTADRILLADNRTNDLATYDDERLANLLANLANNTGTLAGTGYDGEDLDNLLADLASDEPLGPLKDPKPSKPDQAQKKRKVKLGDVYSNGTITLVCGDATSRDSYATLDAGSIDMVFTDPPYGVEYEGGTGLTIQNDETDEAKLGEMLAAATDLALVATSRGAAWYVCHPGGPLANVFYNVYVGRGIMRQGLVWVKDQLVLGRSDYHYRHEPIIYGWTPGAAHYFIDDRSQDTIWQDALTDWQQKDTKRLNQSIFKAILEYAKDDTWHIPRPHSSPEHPTMKPVDLVAKAIRNSTKKGAHVLDPFAGSGSTLLAAWQQHRHATGIELDPKYVAVTLDRLEDIGVTMTKQ